MQDFPFNDSEIKTKYFSPALILLKKKKLIIIKENKKKTKDLNLI